MNTPMFLGVDCIELYVSSLEEGIGFYREGLGLSLLWKNETSAGLGMPEGKTEIVLQTQRQQMNVDFLVEDVEKAVLDYEKAGGTVVHAPFDIPIGKCAVVRDRWNNQYVLLDMTKGTYQTDNEGNITGVVKQQVV
jgi:predicted enzyme related to lactoylglutathione lyase